jgi:hypothetical protein
MFNGAENKCGAKPLGVGVSYLQTYGRAPWKGDRPIARLLPSQYKINIKSRQKEGFETTVPTSKQYKTAHALK